MHILVLGATGAIGILLIREALAASHTVVVYARSPQKIPEDLVNHEDVTIIQGGLTDVETLKRALEGVHAVVSALGPAVSKGPLHPSGTPIAKGYAVVVEAMKQQNVKRLIALGTSSNKDPHDKFDLEFWVLVNGVATFARTAYKDMVAIGETIRASGDLVWTLARVPILTSQKKTEVVAGYVGDKKTKAWLSRAGYAAWVIQELDKNEWARESPLISLA